MASQGPFFQSFRTPSCTLIVIFGHSYYTIKLIKLKLKAFPFALLIWKLRRGVGWEVDSGSLTHLGICSLLAIQHNSFTHQYESLTGITWPPSQQKFWISPCFNTNKTNSIDFNLHQHCLAPATLQIVHE